MASRRRDIPQAHDPPATSVAWGFYPDDRNPHRVGYLTVTDGPSGRRYTYWVEPRWLDGYLQAIAGWQGADGRPPDPAPPPPIVVPAGEGAPGEWDDARVERAKVTCWQLTGNGWGVTRDHLLAHPAIED